MSFLPARTLPFTWAMLLLIVALPRSEAAAPARPATPPTPRAAAPYDITGYWVSVVTEDWLERMTMPPKGFPGGLPVNAAARKFAEGFDAAADKAAGEACRAYGAPGILRMPGRLHISWQDDSTLRVDFSAGTQTRLIVFGRTPETAQPSLQGQSVGSWSEALHLRQFARPAQETGRPALRVVTDHLRLGYLQKNGFPYSANAVMTEHFDRFELNGTPWIVVTTTVEDPEYLSEPLIWSTQFRKEPDSSKWKPTACGEF
ncbi:MAG: hypothetical protein ABI859_01550 [Pseudomonadota bacterium]